MSDPGDVQMTFGEHLDELRRRLWYAVAGIGVALIVTSIYAQAIMDVLKRPVEDALRAAGQEPVLIATHFMDPIMAYMKVALIAAVFVASPWIAYQLWKFTAAGLYPNERRYVYVFGPASALLFVAGTVFSYFIIVWFGIAFLVNFGVEMGVRMLLELQASVMFVLLLSLVMGLVFELPLVMLALVKMRVCTVKMYSSKRKFFVVIAVIAAAVITPTTDPVNLTLAALPMLALYELGIVLCRFTGRRRKAGPAG